MKTMLISGFLALLSAAAYSQQKLKPAQNVFDPPSTHYYSAVQRMLLDGDSAAPPDIRYLALPSFDKEYSLCIGHSDSGYYALYRIPEQQIWTSGKFFRNDASGDYAAAVEKRRCGIARESAVLLLRLVGSAVRTAEQPAEEELGRDGTTYYFSCRDSGYKTAKVWHPLPGSDTRELADIMEEIVRQAKAGKDSIALSPAWKERACRLTEKYPLPAGERVIGPAR